MKARMWLIAVPLLWIATTAGAQSNEPIAEALERIGFAEHTLVDGDEFITYYLRAYSSRPANLVMFVQGTDPLPLFFYTRADGEISVSRTFNDDFASLDSTYTYAIVAKPGLAGVRDRTRFSIPQEYHEKNHRQYRVNQISRAIEHIRQNHLDQPMKVVLYGHSEGAQIAAAVAAENESITHLGFWSGNVLNNFYEFALFERLAVQKGLQSDSLAHMRITELLDWYRSIIEDPLSTAIDDWGYTNRRWSSWEEAPINDLLRIDIPIYAQFASHDESTPIETAYLLPAQFIRHRKENLTFEVCMGCDHSYRRQVDGETHDRWAGIFDDFIRWSEQLF